MYRHVTRAACLAIVLAAPGGWHRPSSPRNRRPRPPCGSTRGTRFPSIARPTTATLPNGLRYFVRQNGHPEKRVSLRLVVKSGSIEEADDQQGLAHFIEHMAFNGSTHFKPGALVAAFEAIGARLGPHVNAYTSFDETVYMLDLPSDQAAIVANGLTALADFAGGLTLDPAEVEKERGVVIEEWRGGLGAGSTNPRQADSRSCTRSRATSTGCRSASPRSSAPRRSRGFARTTTPGIGPERMAVVVVGDIDTAADRERHQDDVRAAEGTRQSRARTRHPRADSEAARRQRHHRHRGHAVERADRPQASEGAGRARRRLPARSGRSG